jgi:hypothetical protein
MCKTDAHPQAVVGPLEAGGVVDEKVSFCRQLLGPGLRRTCTIQGTFGTVQGIFRTVQGIFRTIQGTSCTAQGTFGAVQGTFGTIRGTFGTIQGTFGAVQRIFGAVQGTLAPLKEHLELKKASGLWM